MHQLSEIRWPCSSIFCVGLPLWSHHVGRGVMMVSASSIARGGHCNKPCKYSRRCNAPCMQPLLLTIRATGAVLLPWMVPMRRGRGCSHSALQLLPYLPCLSPLPMLLVSAVVEKIVESILSWACLLCPATQEGETGAHFSPAQFYQHTSDHIKPYESVLLAALAPNPGSCTNVFPCAPGWQWWLKAA